jgi:hypothetical protein
MIPTDPIKEVEQQLAAELVRMHRDLGLHPTRSHVHVSRDTVVYVVDGDELPDTTAERRAAGETALARLLEGTLGRELSRPISITRLSPGSLLVLARLRAQSARTRP